MNDTMTQTTSTGNMANDILLNVFSKISNNTANTGARFINMTYTNQQGETSKYTLLMGVNLENLYRQDLYTLNQLRPTLSGWKLVACQELINSIQNSLEKGIGQNDDYTLKDYYLPVTPNGEVKLHEENGKVFFYVRGYVTKKQILIPGNYKTVNSSDKTLAKKELEKLCKRGKIRTFKIEWTQLMSVRFDGNTLVIGQ